jgi:peptidoglycan biosynthesis protein MviN/MurJ (putative lipid II flippase)
VLRGDMSFVGPRPERPFFVAQLGRADPVLRAAPRGEAGITGWAQVKYRYGASVEDAIEKLRYDLYYIKHLSIGFDLTIVFDTVKVISVRQGGQVSAPPDLHIRPALACRKRLREITGFSIYSGVIDWANKLNYQLDELVIGIFLGTPAVAIWAVAERIVSATQRLTNQLNGVLFPVIVDSDATSNRWRLRQILVQGTRLSLATVLPIAVVLLVLGDVLIRAWTGPDMAAAAPILQVLTVAVVFRVGNATGNQLLKGSGEHRLLAWTNLGAGLANLGFSLYLVRDYGLTGVAVGTLIPIALCAVFILNPAACRRVGLTVRSQMVDAVLPALWPAVVVFSLLSYSTRAWDGTLLALAAQAAVGAAVYYALFFGIAIGRTDRTLYFSKVQQLMRRSNPVPAVALTHRADGARP